MSRWDDSLDALVRHRGRALITYAYLVCNDRSEAEDLVQEALAKVFSRPGVLQAPQALETYVRRAILTTYLDGFRSRKRWAAVRHLHAAPSRDERPSVQPEPLITEKLRIHEALAVLTPRERACVVLRFYDDLPLAQIADQLSIATGTVKRYLADALDKLEHELGPLTDNTGETTLISLVESRG